VVAVIGAWGNLTKVTIALLRMPVSLVVGIARIIRSPDPVSIQLAERLDYFYIWLIHSRFSDDPLSYPRLFTASCVPLTTWLRHPSWGLDSCRRHLRALRENEDILRQRIVVHAN
jgi:hypothetical protein